MAFAREQLYTYLHGAKTSDFICNLIYIHSTHESQAIFGGLQISAG